jgi:hypothetical protein
VERLKTLLCSLVGPALKLGFLREYVGDGTDPNVARALDALCAASARAEPTAREPVLAVAMLLAGSGEDPPVSNLGHAAAELGLPNLGRLLRRAPDPPAPVDERVPEYGRGRELSLGERKSLARAPSRALFDKLLRDPNPSVIRQLLENPRLTEADVLRLAARRPANVGALRMLARTEWLLRPRVRMALIRNPATPSSVAVPLIATCTRSELAELKGHTECSDVVRAVASELWALRAGLSRVYPSSSSSSSQRSSAPSVTFDAQGSQRGGSS